jgi:hypothetical protein
VDEDGPQQLRYYVYEDPRFVFLNSSERSLSLAPNVTFAEPQQFVLLVEVRDDQFPPLSGWVFLDVRVSSAEAVGPVSGFCYLDARCPLVLRGAGGPWPWTRSVLVSLLQNRTENGTTALYRLQYLAVLSRSTSTLRFTMDGGTRDFAEISAVTTDVTLFWTPPASLPFGDYAIRVQSPAEDTVFGSVAVSSVFHLEFPFKYATEPLTGCVCDGVGGCGNGRIFRRVTCENMTSSLSNRSVEDYWCRQYVDIRPDDSEPCFVPCILPALQLTSWSSCPRVCVPGAKQFRVARCVSPTGLEVAASECGEVISDTVRNCSSDCVYSGRVREWGECSSLGCGVGVQFQSTFCLTRTGRRFAASSSLCDSLPESKYSSRECNAAVSETNDAALSSTLPACATHDVVVSPWSRCPKPCVPAGAAPPQATRSVACVNKASRATVAMSVCAAAGFSIPVTSRQCAAEPCIRPHFEVSAWSACSASCGPGTRTRRLRCVQSTGERVDVSVCRATGAPEPATSEECVVRESCRCTSSAACPFPFSECLEGLCQCTGKSGEGCQVGIPAFALRCGVNDTGVVDVYERCCFGDLSTTGACCSDIDGNPYEYDRNGVCCPRGVDACGVCGGPSVARDINGVCCSHMLSASGLCCEHDECGVCGGNNECGLNAQLIGLVNAEQIFRTFSVLRLRGLQVALQHRIAAVLRLPNSSVVVTAFAEDFTSRSANKRLTSIVVNFTLLSPAMTASDVAGMLYTGKSVLTSPPSSTTVTSVMYFDRVAGELVMRCCGWCGVDVAFTVAACGCLCVAVCGNGLCEIGEGCNDAACSDGGCISDCSTPVRHCDKDPDKQSLACNGHGLCNRATGTCDCFAGYRGDTCEKCRVGLQQAFEGAVCTNGENFRPLPSTTPSPTPSPRCDVSADVPLRCG